ncbi:MAG: ubiquitin carboxyl-terminal hydrolase 14 [Myxococcales bacterium]
MACPHIEKAGNPPARTPTGCEECLKTGSDWVQLRRCLSCGHVGCCDSSPNKHATAHYHKTKHPVIQTFEPGEAWKWCYVDEVQA